MRWTRGVLDALRVHELLELPRNELAGIVRVQSADHARHGARTRDHLAVEGGDETANEPGRLRLL
eukprot:1863193-Prymnesium_polylepis.1